MLCICERYVGKNKSTLAENTAIRHFYLAYCFCGQKIDVEKTARTIVTQMNDDSNVRICKSDDDSNDTRMIVTSEKLSNSNCKIFVLQYRW